MVSVWTGRTGSVCEGPWGFSAARPNVGLDLVLLDPLLFSEAPLELQVGTGLPYLAVPVWAEGTEEVPGQMTVPGRQGQHGLLPQEHTLQEP